MPILLLLQQLYNQHKITRSQHAMQFSLQDPMMLMEFLLEVLHLQFCHHKTQCCLYQQMPPIPQESRIAAPPARSTYRIPPSVGPRRPLEKRIHGGKPYDKWLVVACIQCQRVRKLKVGSQHTAPKWQDKLWEVIRTHQQKETLLMPSISMTTTEIDDGLCRTQRQNTSLTLMFVTVQFFDDI